MALNRLLALTLLSECTGDDIWSVEYCRDRRIPEAWIEELSDCFESGFERQSQTIFVQDTIVNQYQGIRDVDLAIKLGEYLNLDVTTLNSSAITRASLVRAIQQAATED